MPTLIMDNVPVEEAGSSVGLNGLMRSVGTTIAGAVMAAILTSKTMELAPGVTIPDHDAFKLCFFVGACAAISGALIALLVPRQRLRALAREAAATAAADYLASHLPTTAATAAEAAVHSYAVAYWCGAAVFAFGAVLSALLFRRRGHGVSVATPATGTGA